MINFFEVNPEKINTIFIGTSDNSLVPRSEQPTYSSSTGPFLLYPAATWPHKNHINLIQAFHILLSREALPKLKLICTGHQTAYYSQIEALIKDLKLVDKVLFKGVVSDSELKQLYSKCIGVVVPTKYEAGSFPLMESIAQTIPVICSNVTSLPDTVRDKRFVFNPNDLSEMASIMRRLILDEEFRALSVANSVRIRSSILNQDIKSKIELILRDIQFN